MDNYHPNQDDVKFIIAKRIRDNCNKWDWRSLSLNKNTTLDIIETTLDLEWPINILMQNPNMTWQFIRKWFIPQNEEENKNKKYEIISFWKWECVHLNYDLVTWEDVKADPELPWCWSSLSSNITWDIVKAHPDKPWNYSAISKNKTITIENVLESIDRQWDWSALSSHTTWDVVQANPELPWCWSSLSSNPNITWDIVKAHPDKPWDYRHYSCNINLTNDIVENNPGIQFDMFEYKFMRNYRNYKLKNKAHILSTLEIIEKIKRDRTLLSFTRDVQMEYEYSSLSFNGNLTWDIVKENPDMPWDYTLISASEIITWQIVEDNQHINWDWEMLSDNPSILELSENDVEFLSCVHYIQTRWRDALYNPKYAICRKRILREFNELGKI
jgi:hypothetical protein